MKVFSIIFTIIALGLIIFNAMQVNLDAPFQGQSIIALITVLAAICAIALVQILAVSKRIEKLSKRRK